MGRQLKRHRAIVVVGKTYVRLTLNTIGFAPSRHFTRDHSKAMLLVMTLNAWAGKGFSYGLVPSPKDDTYEIHEYRTYRDKTRETPYYIDIDQTAANFQRLYGEKDERIQSNLPSDRRWAS